MHHSSDLHMLTFGALAHMLYDARFKYSCVSLGFDTCLQLKNSVGCLSEDRRVFCKFFA